MTKTSQEAIEPQFRIETRISYVAREQGIEVPLGEYRHGRWFPITFVEGDGGSLQLTPHELADWLAGPNSFESPFLEGRAVAEKAVNETIQRCRALAEAVRQEKVERPVR